MAPSELAGVEVPEVKMEEDEALEWKGLGTT